MKELFKSSEVLKVNNLSIKFHDFYALSNISFSINTGDFIALVGANGAGKSTLLNSLYGLLEPSTGSILYNNNFLNNIQPAHSIGFSAQRCIVDWYLNVKENVYLGAVLGGLKTSQLEQATQQALDLLYLSDKSTAEVETLSGGQQQRVQIARAIVHNPELYILDEPTTGLDPNLSERFFQFLKTEQNKNKAIIVSSHDMYLVEKYCNKVLFLKNGNLVFFDDMQICLKSNSQDEKVKITFSKKFMNNISLPKEKYILFNDPDDDHSVFVILKSKYALSELIDYLSLNYDILEVKSIEDVSLRNFFKY